jgi:hypothetical protein
MKIEISWPETVSFAVRRWHNGVNILSTQINARSTDIAEAAKTKEIRIVMHLDVILPNDATGAAIMGRLRFGAAKLYGGKADPVFNGVHRARGSFYLGSRKGRKIEVDFDPRGRPYQELEEILRKSNSFSMYWVARWTEMKVPAGVAEALGRLIFLPPTAATPQQTKKPAPAKSGDETGDFTPKQLEGLKKPITDRIVSRALYNVLEMPIDKHAPPTNHSPILLIWQLASKTDAELLKLKNFGRVKLKEVHTLLARWDLTTGMRERIQSLPEGTLPQSSA